MDVNQLDVDTVEKFVKKFNLVIDKLKLSKKILYIKSSIKNKEDSLLFFRLLSQKTCTTWKEIYRKIDSKRYVFHKAWICEDINASCTKKRDCGTIMEIFIEKVSNLTNTKDSFLMKTPSLTCIICLYPRRQQMVRGCKSKEVSQNLKYLKHLKEIPDNVKELFFKYFDGGNDIFEAEALYLKNIRERSPSKLQNFIPDQKQVNCLYLVWAQKSHSFNENKTDVSVAKDSFALFDLPELISAIPVEDPLITKKRKSVCNAPSLLDTKKEHLSEIENNKLISNTPITNTKMLQKTNSAINPQSDSSSNLFSGCFSNPQLMQHITVSSSNHLNGASFTVTPSKSPSLMPTVKNCQVTLTPLILPNMTIKKDVKASLSDCLHLYDYSTSRQKSDYKTSSKESMCSQQTLFDSQISSQKSSVYLENSALQDKIELPKMNIFSQNMSESNVNFPSESCTANNLSCSCKEFSKHITEIRTNSYCKQCIPFKKCNKIHITNTAFQSGGQVSMQSVHQASQKPIIDAFYFSEAQTIQPNLNESLKIKEEPPDLPEENLLEFTSFDVVPLITNVSSTSEVKIEKDKLETLSNMVEKGYSENLSSNISHYEQKDEDQQFLMSLLPLLKHLPGDLKNTVKTKMKQLLTSSIEFSNKRKRKADELGES